jgi:membrane protease YdiL (CAAX protease family)
MLLGMSLVLEGGLLVLAHLLGLVVGMHPWEALRLEMNALLLGCVATLPLVFFLFLSVRMAWPPVRRLCRTMRELAGSLFASATWVDLAFVALLAGVCEETFFRGFLQSLLAREWNQGVALGGTALLFAAAHPVSRLYASIAAAMSMYLGGLYVVSHNLLPSILCHGLYDFVALVYWQRQAQRRAEGAPKPGGAKALGADPAEIPQRREGGER